MEGSLDKYRLELHAVLFPVFLHCYFELILKGFPYDAHTFMERSYLKPLFNLCRIS